jgi:hypothetical protein
MDKTFNVTPIEPQYKDQARLIEELVNSPEFLVSFALKLIAETVLTRGPVGHF